MKQVAGRVNGLLGVHALTANSRPVEGSIRENEADEDQAEAKKAGQR